MAERMHCEYCNTPVNYSSKFCPNCGSIISISQRKNNDHTIAIILGYIFVLLTGWIGLIIALYLITRENSRANFHGQIQLIISIVIIFISTIRIFV